MTVQNSVPPTDGRLVHLPTSLVTTDTYGMVLTCSLGTELLFGGATLIGRPFIEVLGDATKFGAISKLTVHKLLDSLDTGSIVFRMEDGRTFHSLTERGDMGGLRIQWTDISSVVIDAGDYDRASGLLSRRDLVTALNKVMSKGSEICVFQLEIDNFGDLSDRYGEALADHLIRRTAERISGQLEPTTALANATGGQFFAVVRQVDAPRLAEALLDILARPHLVNGKMIYSTASIGIAPVSGTDADIVLRSATLALKRAKADGGNRAETFTFEMQQAIDRKQVLETELRKALALREFSVVYQPQYQVEGRRLVGFEALLRWNHPDHGPISPSEFIPLAEELGLIVPIGEWVLRIACRQAVSWPKHISISVNVSPLQFRSPTIISMVKAALEGSGLDPMRLDLEVTEGAVLANSASIMETFRQLKEIGVRFSMDDFGTGYSSLSYLQKFPFDKIKIDQSFVKSISADSDSLSIIRAICALGKTLGLTTIAEGVETEDQFTQIEKKGCQQVQGYLTGRPLAADVANQLVISCT